MANNIKYEIILYWSQEDQAFIAEVPEIPGCAADGATYQEAVANVEVVMQQWIERRRSWAAPSPHREADCSTPDRLAADDRQGRRRR